MNILGIDFGKRRMGLAWVDTDLGVVLPFGKLDGTPESFLDELPNIIEEEKVDKVVFGIPIGLDGKENDNSERVKNFAEELEAKIGKPVEFIDERFSSRLADQMEGDASRDEKSAMIILQSFIDKVD